MRERERKRERERGEEGRSEEERRGEFAKNRGSFGYRQKSLLVMVVEKKNEQEERNVGRRR